MAEPWRSPIPDMDTSDAEPPQLLPANVQLEFVLEDATFDPENLRITFQCSPVPGQAVLAAHGIDPSKPIRRPGYTLFLPNRAKQEPDAYQASRVRLRQIRERFGLPLDGPLMPDQFIGRRILGLTKEREQTPEQAARYGRTIDVDAIVKVLS